MRLKQDDVFKFKQRDALTFRRELAAKLWAHGKWKEDSSYETAEEQLGHDYGEYKDTLCEFFR